MAVAAETTEEIPPIGDLMTLARKCAGVRALYVNHPRPRCYMAGGEINRHRFDHGLGPAPVGIETIYAIEGGMNNEIFW